MKDLTISERILDVEITLLEARIDRKLSDNFKAIIKKYAGVGIKERYFTDAHLTLWELHQFLNFIEMFKLTEEFMQVGWGRKLPFAYDPGGWHFCLSFDDDTLGAVVVNRWTDYGPDEQFLKIADSFEEFIEGLHENGPAV